MEDGRSTAEAAEKALPETPTTATTTKTTSVGVQGAVGTSDDNGEEGEDVPADAAANFSSESDAIGIVPGSLTAADAERSRDVPTTTSASETAAPAAAASAAATAEVEDSVPTHSELRYAVESYNAIYKPVLLTMVLTALAVVFLSPSGSPSSGDSSSTPDTGPSNADQLSSAVTTSLIIVSVVCAVTVAVVLLYKYRCLKILWGYLIGATALLLGYLSYSMIAVAIYRYNLVADKISLYLFAYNFAVVGAVSIFAGGVVQHAVVPHYITQAYLIANSVLAAWQLSAIFDVWTSWALLIALALYDLFAVLTPCGPLKCLVKLLSQDDAPALPGLLYEAPLPGGGPRAVRNGRRRRRRREEGSVGRSNNDPEGNRNHPGHNQELDNHTDVDRQGGDHDDEAPIDADSDPEISDPTPAIDEGIEVSIEGSDHAASTSVGVSLPQGHETADEEEKKEEERNTNDGEAPEPQSLSSFGIREESHSAVESTAPRATIPLALAKLYKLPLVDDPQGEVSPTPSNGGSGLCSGGARSGIVVDHDDSPRPDPPSHTAEELRSLVCVMLPVGGGRIESAPEEDPSYIAPVGGLPRLRYRILDRAGAIRRILVVDEHGKVFQVVNKESDNSGNERGSTAASTPPRSSIRLGLGDFVFYSVLVSLAAVHGFLTFVVCSLVVLSGLGLTLLLLALRGAALPALPISIFLGVVFYVATMFVIEPWVREIFVAQVYV